MNYELQKGKKYFLTYADLVAIGRGLAVADQYIEDNKDKLDHDEYFADDKAEVRLANQIWHRTFKNEMQYRKTCTIRYRLGPSCPVCRSLYLLLHQMGVNMKFRVKTILNGVSFEMLISAKDEKEALKEMTEVANNYPEKRLEIVSIKPEVCDLPHSA